MQDYAWLECDKGYFGVLGRKRRQVMMVIEYYGSLSKDVHCATAPRLIDIMAWAETQGIDYKISGLDGKPWDKQNPENDDTAVIKGLPAAPSPSMVIGDDRVIWERVNRKAELLKDAIFELAKLNRDLEIALIEALDNATNTVIVD